MPVSPATPTQSRTRLDALDAVGRANQLVVSFDCLLRPSQFDAITMQFLVNGYVSCSFLTRTGAYHIQKRNLEDDSIFTICVQVAPNREFRCSVIRVSFESGATRPIRQRVLSELVDNIEIINDSAGRQHSARRPTTAIGICK